MAHSLDALFVVKIGACHFLATVAIDGGHLRNQLKIAAAAHHLDVARGPRGEDPCNLLGVATADLRKTKITLQRLSGDELAKIRAEQGIEITEIA